MTIQPIRSRATLRFSAAVLLFAMAYACGQPASDPKRDLIASLKGAEVGGYLFAMQEDEARTTASLTNKLVDSPTPLGKDTTNLILRYARVEDHTTKAARTYKSEILRTASSQTLLVTDLESGKVVEKDQRTLAPAPGSNVCGPLKVFDTLAECAAYYECSTRGLLQCEANRTCQAQLGGLTCCLKNGDIVDFLLIESPDTGRCLLAPWRKIASDRLAFEARP